MDFLFFIIISHPLPLVARGAEGTEIFYFSVSSEPRLISGIKIRKPKSTNPCGAAHIKFLTFVRIVFNKEKCSNYLISHLLTVRPAVASYSLAVAGKLESGQAKIQKILLGAPKLFKRRRLNSVHLRCLIARR
jgi:hypothetical protein